MHVYVYVCVCKYKYFLLLSSLVDKGSTFYNFCYKNYQDNLKNSTVITTYINNC